MPCAFDPFAERLYLLTALAEAQNACEVLACEVALRALEKRFPQTRCAPVLGTPTPDDDLTDFLF